VIGGLHFRQVSAGGGHTCGVTASNVAFCWGDNQFGALGDGTTIQRLRPRRVAGRLAFRSVEAGENHTCGVTLSYVTYCWGTNHVAHLGHGTTTGPQTCHTFLGDLSCSTRPVRVVGGHLFRKIGAGGDHNCAVTRTNVPYCWGRNDLGELGTGTFDAPEICEVPLEELPCSSRPLRVTGRLLLRQINTGTHHTCGVNTSNVAYCWGYGQGGQLGDGTEDIRATPKRVAGGHQFRHVSGAAYHSCGVTTDGVAYCWGLNQIGEVGDGTGTQRLTPVAVAPPAP
jgi:alpha-tubulin suppressor-like RCC1 family protein